MMNRYCTSCKAKVKPTKKFNWIIFLLLCLTGVGGLVYLIYYFIIKKSTRCPVHGIKTKGWLWQRKHAEDIAATDYGVGSLH